MTFLSKNYLYKLLTWQSNKSMIENNYFSNYFGKMFIFLEYSGNTKEGEKRNEFTVSKNE